MLMKVNLIVIQRSRSERQISLQKTSVILAIVLGYLIPVVAGAQKVYLCKKGHNYGPHFLMRSTPLIIKKCCCRVWGVALYLKSLN